MSVVGTRIGRIRVESVLGRGGMGEVYVGHDETLQRQVALKSIRASHRLSSQAKARFVREAQVLSRLDHPNICKIHDFIEDTDRDYLVLELIKGRDLAAAIGDGLDPAKWLPIARQIAEALVAAHAEGIVHRDLKPENVMLTEAGELKVLDFGLARPGQDSEPADSELADPVTASPAAEPTLGTLADGAGEAAGQTLPTEVGDFAGTLATAPGPAEPRPASGAGPAIARTEVRTTLGTVMGTVTYMSPEQARGEVATTASDMYSFGLVLQTLFTGRGPYPLEADRDEVFRRALAADTLPVTGADGDLTKLIASLKSPAPAARPTAVATAERLRWIADRPKRRARWLAAAAALAILAVGGLKYTIDLRRERTIAVEAREVAEQRRGQAEDLIGFMLGDLREKLAPVGRLEILDDVGEQAMEYFASVPEEELTDDELLDRSKALYQIGEVRIAQGNLPSAEEPLRQSLALARELSERDASDGNRLFGVGQSHFWVGTVYWLQGNLDKALAEWKSYFEVSERLVEIDPSNLDWQQELAYANTNLGVVYEAQGDLDRALEKILLSNGIKRRLVAADPGNPERERSLANGLSWLASTLLSAGRIPQALEEFRAELQIRQRLAGEDPLNTDSSYRLSISHGYVGNLSLMSGDVEAALEHQRQAKDLMQDLVAHDPDNLDWRRELAVSHASISGTLIEAGRGQRAHAEVETAIRFLAGLVESDPSNEDWRRELALARQKKAAVLLANGNASASVDAAREALSLLDALEAGDLKLQITAETHVLLGTGYARSGRPKHARNAWTRALEILEPLRGGTRSPHDLDPLARALLHLNRLEEAKLVVAMLNDSGYARPDLVALCRKRGLVNGIAGRGTAPQSEGDEDESPS